MRPYRLRMRLSSIRLNVTRLGTGPAAALRAAARASLGSASSDIELMERLLVMSFNRHDRANRGRPQEGTTAESSRGSPATSLAAAGPGAAKPLQAVTVSLAES